MPSCFFNDNSSLEFITVLFEEITAMDFANWLQDLYT